MVLISQNKKDIVILGAGSHLWTQSGVVYVAKTAGSLKIGVFGSEKEAENQLQDISQAFADGISIYHMPIG